MWRGKIHNPIPKRPHETGLVLVSNHSPFWTRPQSMRSSHVRTLFSRIQWRLLLQHIYCVSIVKTNKWEDMMLLLFSQGKKSTEGWTSMQEIFTNTEVLHLKQEWVIFHWRFYKLSRKHRRVAPCRHSDCWGDVSGQISVQEPTNVIFALTQSDNSSLPLHLPVLFATDDAKREGYRTWTIHLCFQNRLQLLWELFKVNVRLKNQDLTESTRKK